MMSDFQGFERPISNFSPIPHELIQQLPKFKTLAELKIVLYVLRHTWGYQDEYKKITLDEFENGRKLKDGSRMDNGVGMTRPSIVAGIKQAIENGFLYAHIDDNDKARVKKFYSLTERGLKDFTSDVKELNTSSKETLLRTEKDTKEKTNGNTLFEEMLKLVKKELKQYGGTSEKIAKMLLGLCTGKDKELNLENPITPALLLEFCNDWDLKKDKNGQSLTRPRNISSVKSAVENWQDSKSQKLRSSALTTAAAANAIFTPQSNVTDNEQADALAVLKAARKGKS